MFKSTYPSEKSYCEPIYNNPKYYSGYYVKSKLFNLTSIGFVPAEENHLSNVTHMGSGSSWLLHKNHNKLLKKQQPHVLNFQSQEENWSCSTFFSKTRITGDHIEENQLAAKSLVEWL